MTETSTAHYPETGKVVHPYQFRLPKPTRNNKPGEVDPWFGANRSFWNERILPTARNDYRPEVKSIVVRQRGSRRGVRFVLFDSAKAYFDKLRREHKESAS
jgi:hypothetical protein